MMNKYISIVFDPSRQDMALIMDCVKNIKAENKDAILISPLIPSYLAEKHQMDKELSLQMENVFPNALSFFNPIRVSIDLDAIVEKIIESSAPVFVIGAHTGIIPVLLDSLNHRAPEVKINYKTLQQ
jgi:hypothetical protein